MRMYKYLYVSDEGGMWRALYLRLSPASLRKRLTNLKSTKRYVNYYGRYSDVTYIEGHPIHAIYFQNGDIIDVVNRKIRRYQMAKSTWRVIEQEYKCKR